MFSLSVIIVAYSPFIHCYPSHSSAPYLYFLCFLKDDLEAELACLEEELENEALFEEEEKAVAKAGASSIRNMNHNLYGPLCDV